MATPYDGLEMGARDSAALGARALERATKAVTVRDFLNEVDSALLEIRDALRIQRIETIPSSLPAYKVLLALLDWRD